MLNLYTDYVATSCPSVSCNEVCPSFSCCCCSCSHNCCSCDGCSSTPINTVSTSRLVRLNPSPFYGFSQSILIQRPPSRKSPICDLGSTRNAYGNLSGFRDVGSDWIRYQAMKSNRKGIQFGGCGRMSVLKESYAFHKFDTVCNDAESIISLLTDESGDERRKKKVSVSKKGTPRENVEFRKRVGSVAVSEKVMDKLEKQRIKKNQNLECDRRDHDAGVRTSRRLDLWKNSRKKLGEESVSHAHVSDSRKGYGIKKQYNYRLEGSVSDVNSSDSSYKYVTGSGGFVDGKKISGEKSRESKESVVSAGEFCTSCGQVTSGKEQQTKRIQCDDDRFISNEETRNAFRRKESSSLIQDSANEVHEQHKQEHLVALNQVNLRKAEEYNLRADGVECYEENTNISRRHFTHSENQNTSTRLNSTIKHDSDTWIKRHEEASNLNRGSLKEENDKSCQEHHVVTSQTELMRKKQAHIEIADTSNSYADDASRFQQKREHVVSLSSEVPEGESSRTRVQVESQEQSRKSSKDLAGTSQVHFDEILIAGSSEERLYTEKIYSRENVKETQEYVKEAIKQTESNITSTSQTRIEEIAEEEDKRSLPSGILTRLQPPSPSIEVTHEHVLIAKQPEPRFVKEPSRHPRATPTSHVRIEELGEEDERNSFGGPSQYLDRHPQSIEVKETHGNYMSSVQQTGLWYEVQMPLRKASSVKETSEPPWVTSTSQVRIEEIGEEEGISLPSGEPCSSQRLDTPLGPPSSIELHPVYFESASTFPSHDQDSHSSSGGESSIFMDPQSPGISAHDDVLGSAESSIYVDFEHGKSRKESLSQLSGSVTGNEPHDEMLPLEQQPLRRGQSENFESEHLKLRKESSSQLPGSVAGNDPRDEMLPLEQQPLKRGQSENSETSKRAQSLIEGTKARDHADAQDASVEIGTSRTPIEPSFKHQPLLERTHTQSPIEGPSVLSSSSGGVAGETNIELNVNMINWSQSDGRQLRRSHRRSDAIYELQESGKKETGSGTVDQSKWDIDPSPNVVSSPEENEVEMRQGRLVRSNQVMKERFDEWEEAYRLETEQRKIDQTFMREALEEAKKAADIWEVPVGAVLVQDGKIIARGHNLVEEMRDSTAHAEIICIRDASNFLKTWRLSETILYVTLEPCAMCAGAILQARIGTLVYGAPNKLLGADGSWVRLFPGSVDEEGGSESTTKAEGPVHPFHSKMTIRRGILEDECGELMHQSFKRRKKKGKKVDEQPSNRETHYPSKLLHKMHHRFNFPFCM